MTRRTERINNLIRQEICDLLQRQIKDPRLSSFISVTKVVTSPDLRHAKVLVSVFGDEIQKEAVLQGFRAASGFFRRELARRLTLRRIPELSFYADDSIERGARVLNIIDGLAKVSQDKSEH